jgi:16S rRNA (guanine966-N2)-methyltransferase
MRIIAGSLKGRRLMGPARPGVRPTSDSLRETLFNVLGPAVAGAGVLDAFAGTGALGLEALSRGARQATFVERDRGVLSVLRENVARCGVQNACVIVECDFFRMRVSPAAFDLILIDPPYDVEDLGAVVTVAAAALVPGGRLVLEHSKRRASPESAAGLARGRLLIAGDSALSFYGS